MNHRKIVLVFVIFFGAYSVDAQVRFFTKSGVIRFYSKAPLESIEAVNKSGTCVLDTKSGLVQFSILMRGFEFKKALMQEHFNENYVESNKFPKAEFKGQVLNNPTINYGKEGSYIANVKGRLSIHGETKEIETKGTVLITGGKITINADFNILLSDYKIEIPSLVKDKVSNSVKISTSCPLDILKS
ncbi:MAG: YceI family protein [Chitinophagaceae bacterium]